METLIKRYNDGGFEIAGIQIDREVYGADGLNWEIQNTAYRIKELETDGLSNCRCFGEEEVMCKCILERVIRELKGLSDEYILVSPSAYALHLSSQDGQAYIDGCNHLISFSDEFGRGHVRNNRTIGLKDLVLELRKERELHVEAKTQGANVLSAFISSITKGRYG